VHILVDDDHRRHPQPPKQRPTSSENVRSEVVSRLPRPRRFDRLQHRLSAPDVATPSPSRRGPGAPTGAVVKRIEPTPPPLRYRVCPYGKTDLPQCRLRQVVISPAAIEARESVPPATPGTPRMSSSCSQQLLFRSFVTDGRAGKSVGTESPRQTEAKTSKSRGVIPSLSRDDFLGVH